MSEEDSTDKSQKTEAPTPRKLEEARNRGQVVYSREITNWVIFFVVTVIVGLMGPGIMSDMSDILQTFIGQVHTLPTDGMYECA